MALRCWGENGDGQLGTGNTADSHVPVPVLASGPAPGVTQVAAAEYHSCAVAGTAGVFCWGYGYNGQLGNGGTADSYSPHPCHRVGLRRHRV